MERLTFPKLNTWEGNCDIKTMARMRAKTYNESPGSLGDYDCARCRNRGNFLRVRPDGSTWVEDCSCLKIRANVRRLKQSGLEGFLREKTFAAFEAREDWQKEILEGARAFAKKPEGWFVICGQSGSGKTHLCTAICRELLLRGTDLQYLSWRQQIAGLKGLYEDPAQREQVIGQLQTVPVLYIDDLLKTGGAEPTAADVAIALEILDSRSQSGRTTLISTERMPGELLVIDEALAGRILEKAGDHLYSVTQDTSRNWRLRRLRS